jgi:hypothetical protein
MAKTQTTVVNIDLGEECDVYIGRPSKWGNPFKIGQDGPRKVCIEKFRRYLLNNKELMADIMELDGKILGCHCKGSKPYWQGNTICHGEVIAQEIQNLKLKKQIFK